MFQATGGKIVFKRLGDLGFDFSYSSLPKVYSNQVDLFLNGTIFNASYGEKYPCEGFGDLLIDA
jgi:hypothetical protein